MISNKQLEIAAQQKRFQEFAELLIRARKTRAAAEEFLRKIAPEADSSPKKEDS